MLERLAIVSFNTGYFIMILNTIVLFLILRKLLFKPVQKVLHDRTERIRSQFDEAKFKVEEADRLKEEYEQKLNSIKQEQADILAEARNEAKKRSDIIIKSAEEEVAKIKEKASKDIEDERNLAMLKMKDDISAIAIMIATKVIKAEIDENKHRAMIDEAIERVGAQSWHKQ